MEIDDAITTIEEKYKFSFKEKQKEAVKPVLESKDTFVVLPTGYGKTKIFQYLPELFELVSGEKSSVLVVSPLQSLMLDQVARLNNDGIKSTVVGECQKDKSIVENISSGEYPIVFTSPEAALLPGLWRKCFTTGTFHRRLKAVVIDEAHCITECRNSITERLCIFMRTILQQTKGTSALIQDYKLSKQQQQQQRVRSGHVDFVK